MSELDELSIVEFLRAAAIDGGKRVAKSVAAPILDVARASGAFGLARGTTHADEVRAYYDRSGLIEGHRVDLSEPARSLKTLGVGGPVPAPRPVTATMTLLDAAGGTLTFCSNHVIDARGLAVLEHVTDAKGNQLPLADLRIGRVPLGTPRRLAGSIGYLSNSGVGNFGHWLMLALPLIQHYREYLGHDPDYYYVGTPVYEWHYDSLAALNIGRERIVTEAVSGDRMLAAVVDHHLPPPSPHLDFITNALRQSRGHPEHGSRIYISRSLRPRRRMVNEAACLEVLEAHEFEAVHTEKLTLKEETELFANAEVVVGAHGAGFANLLFCHASCVAVEFFPHGFRSNWFDDTWPGVEISAARGIAYANLYGQRTRTWGLRPRDHPILIDPEELDSVLAACDRTRKAECGIPSGGDEV